jgi:hypothetical protein
MFQIKRTTSLAHVQLVYGHIDDFISYTGADVHISHIKKTLEKIALRKPISKEELDQLTVVIRGVQ